MSTPYQRGTAFEHRVKAELEAEGWLVVRSPASKSPVDLVGLPSRDKGERLPVAVQCKLAGIMAPSDRKALVDLASRYRVLPVMAYTLRPRGLVHYSIVRVDSRITQWPTWSP